MLNTHARSSKKLHNYPVCRLFSPSTVENLWMRDEWYLAGFFESFSQLSGGEE
jgi:hypothetical protein